MAEIVGQRTEATVELTDADLIFDINHMASAGVNMCAKLCKYGARNRSERPGGADSCAATSLSSVNDARSTITFTCGSSESVCGVSVVGDGGATHSPVQRAARWVADEASRVAPLNHQ
jgi:hypothetical protein